MMRFRLIYVTICCYSFRLLNVQFLLRNDNLLGWVLESDNFYNFRKFGSNFQKYILAKRYSYIRHDSLLIHFCHAGIRIKISSFLCIPQILTKFKFSYFNRIIFTSNHIIVEINPDTTHLNRSHNRVEVLVKAYYNKIWEQGVFFLYLSSNKSTFSEINFPEINFRVDLFLQIPKSEFLKWRVK